jgi:hypothetical protein
MIQAKKDGHITSINIIDYKDFFENAIMKWKNISTIVTGFGSNTHLRNNRTYKKKWATIYGD